jgi:hypothetical protein
MDENLNEARDFLVEEVNQITEKAKGSKPLSNE